MQILPLKLYNAAIYNTGSIKTDYINFGAKKNNNIQPAQQKKLLLGQKIIYYPNYNGIKSKTFLSS